MIVKNQLGKREAQHLFEYRDGALYWRHFASGMRPDRLAIHTMTRSRKGGGGSLRVVSLGGKRFLASYLVWNWHHGPTPAFIAPRDGNRDNVSIGNLYEVAPIVTAGGADSFVARQSPAKSDNFIAHLSYTGLFGVQCPCCRQHVDTPTLDVIVLHYGLTDFEARILRAVWRGNGHAVMSNAIFDEMYADDEDGGPDPATMSATLKVCLSHMRDKLKGSGVSIETVGYRRGYRLLMKENEQ